MSPEKLSDWLSKNTTYDKSKKSLKNKSTNRTVSAIVPVHTFGHSCRIDEIIEIAARYHIPVIEDSAESLGSLYKEKHTGTFGLAGILSYNGNKSVTTGGGGMILTDDKNFAQKAKHLTTTAKIPHKWEYIHDSIAYNYRMPNVNAAIGLAQMEYIEKIIENKRETACLYKDFFDGTDIQFFIETENARANYWLNAILLKDRRERDAFLDITNENKIMTRPVWRLMNKLEMYKNCETGNLGNSEWLESKVVNIPSSYRV
jgi:dTDP-4-amino-4,6-dideoxygalactose transaminase